MKLRKAEFEDMPLAANIMVTSFRTAFADFVSRETMDACTNPDNCRAMLESIYREGKIRFLMGGDQGFLCWQETEDGAEIVPITKIAHVHLDDLVGYEISKKKLIENTEAFVNGRKANNFYCVTKRRI